MRSKITTAPPSLTGDEIKKARSELEVWLTPNDFQNKVEMLDRHVTSRELLVSTELKFLRDDALILATFARLINADKVRLEKETKQFPDGHVQVAGSCLKIEITGADRPERKRGDEYKTGAPRVTCAPINDADYVAGVLSQAIEKKIQMNYSPPSPTLVVNLNLGVHGHEEQEAKLELLITAIKKQYASQFAGIYILRNDKLF